MKFFKKHKWFAFAVFSFFILSGVNFYMIFQIVKVIRNRILSYVHRIMKKVLLLDSTKGNKLLTQNLSKFFNSLKILKKM